MKKIIILFIGLISICISCNTTPLTPEQIEQNRIEQALIKSNYTKIIADKQAPIENKFSGVDFLFGEGSITKSQTVYYFISEDNKTVEVSLKEYSKFKIGDKYYSRFWH